jgi:hypothetical protein
VTVGNIRERLIGKYQRTLSGMFFRDSVAMRNPVPLISFTFDDFPKSSLHVGGAILKAHGCRGTYFTSLGLINTVAPAGKIFSVEDLHQAIADGHELGCHTFAHCHSWDTPPALFEQSVIENQRSLRRLIPDASFATMSYPLCCPRPLTKRRVGRHFLCCRGGGQSYNSRLVSSTSVNALFLEQVRDNPAFIRTMIDNSNAARGWLVFATHDVSDSPSRYGLTPSFFDSIVRYSRDSGARVLPMREAWQLVAGIEKGNFN